MILARQHVPAFIDCDPQPDVVVETVEQLLQVPWIASWTPALTLDGALVTPFYRWSVSPHGDHYTLMAEFHEGGQWAVVAYLHTDDPLPLPVWDADEAAAKKAALLEKVRDMKGTLGL